MWINYLLMIILFDLEWFVSKLFPLNNQNFFCRLPNCSRTIGRPGDPINFTDPGYDSFSLSSSDSYPSAINCPSGKLGQIPEHMQTAFMPYDLSQLQYCLKDIKNNDHFPYGKLISNSFCILFFFFHSLVEILFFIKK